LQQILDHIDALVNLLVYGVNGLQSAVSLNRMFSRAEINQ